jgi:hypothetical protein
LEALLLVRSNEPLRASVPLTGWAFSWGPAPSLWFSPFPRHSC